MTGYAASCRRCGSASRNCSYSSKRRNGGSRQGREVSDDCFCLVPLLFLMVVGSIVATVLHALASLPASLARASPGVCAGVRPLARTYARHCHHGPCDAQRARLRDQNRDRAIQRLVGHFRVLNHDPPAMRILGNEPLSEHQRAVEAWLAESSGPSPTLLLPLTRAHAADARTAPGPSLADPGRVGATRPAHSR